MAKKQWSRKESYTRKAFLRSRLLVLDFPQRQQRYTLVVRKDYGSNRHQQFSYLYTTIGFANTMGELKQIHENPGGQQEIRHGSHSEATY